MEAAFDGINHGERVLVADPLHEIDLLEIQHPDVIQVEVQLDTQLRIKVIVAPLHDHAVYLAHEVVLVRKGVVVRAVR